MSQTPPIKPRSVAAWLLALTPAALLVVLLAAGALLQQEPFVATHFGEAWLGQAVMAAVRRAFGWTGLRVFDALCWLGGFLLVAAACRRRSGSAAGALLALAVAVLAALPLASVGPQTFAVLCFGALLALLRLEMKPWQTSVLVVPLLLIWQNLHPSVGVAVVALAAHAAVGWRPSLRTGMPRPWETSLLAPIAAATMFATPGGWAIPSLLADSARVGGAMGLSEWLPLWHTINRFVAVPTLLAAVATSWLLLRNPRRIDGAELLTAIAFFALTIIAYRFVLFWAIALVPPIARAVPPPPAERRVPAWVAPVALVAAAVLTPLLAR